MGFKQRFHTIYTPILAFILGVAIMAYVLGGADEEVIFNSTTGECIRVVADKDIYDCENLPPRHKRVWVN